MKAPDDKNISRRAVLRGSLATAAAVVACHRRQRAWATGPIPDGARVPSLDGALVLAGETLEDAADDFGHIASARPYAVLVPGSVQDIVKMVKFARAHGLKIGGMSKLTNTHSTFGQSQVAAGVVVDMSGLDRIHELNAGDAWVDAGVRWRDLLTATLPLGKSPPMLTDHLDLSVGGVLSVGGIGGQTHRHGFVVDNVLELEVVTGEGTRTNCSATRKSDLFDAVRAGLGQFGIITKARVRLVDVPPMVRTYTARYSDLAAFTADQALLVAQERFDYLEGFASPDGDGGYVFQLEAAASFTPGEPPDGAALLAGLSFTPGTEAFTDASYFDFANRLAPMVELLVENGSWSLPHPWFNAFVPASRAVSTIGSALAATSEDELGGGPILIYPFKRALATAPFLPLPDERVSYLFAILRTATSSTTVSALLGKNRQIYDSLAAAGGVQYAISSIPLTPRDWEAHFGAAWTAFARAKARFDPDNVLTPGQKIFVSP